MNNLIVRTITGSIFIAAIMGAILWNSWAAAILFGLFLVLGVHEFTHLVNKHTAYRTFKWFAIGSAALIYTAFILVFSGFLLPNWLFLAVPLLMAAFFGSLFGKSATPLQDVSLTYFGLIYILVPFLMMAHLCFASDNKWDVIGMFAVIWTNDTMAYVSGRLFGRTQLFERISPKKTWEGTIGGILFALAGGFCWSIFLSDLPQAFWLIVSPLVAAGAIFGDLFESQFKRQIGVKDSGNILPGHGGILDRFDAAFMAIPIFYALWMIYN